MSAETVLTIVKRAHLPQFAQHVLKDFISTPQHKHAISTVHKALISIVLHVRVNFAHQDVRFVSKEMTLWFALNVKQDF
jgi:hypothetical protein